MKNTCFVNVNYRQPELSQ